MFPVKGLSVSVEKLKVETEGPAAGAASAPKASRKRKRQGNADDVTTANLTDLWERFIEHKGPPGLADNGQAKQGKKRQRKEHESTCSADVARKTTAAQSGTKEQQKQPTGRSEKRQKKHKKDKRESLTATTRAAGQDGDEWNGICDRDEGDESAEAARSVKAAKGQERKAGDGARENNEHQLPRDKKPAVEPAAPLPAAPAPSTAKLTPLQASMREKLISARFRHLNETLYTRPSAEAFQLFQDSPEMFSEYHEGFRRQVDVWPENPVDGYIADIKARAKMRFPPRNRTGNQSIAPSQLPLPKPPNSKICTIADLGCGDAKLATSLQPLTPKLRLSIHSFDLQTGSSPLVTRADISNLPLADGCVDVAIFCLALMGTNWTDFIEEAYRVLRWKGELWVAEIKSRFISPAAAQKKKAVVAHSVGNRKKGAAAMAGGGVSGRKSKQAAAAVQDEKEAADLNELAVQVDGAEPAARAKQQETDILAFVEALRRRGFLLNRDLGENAVDMSNKMFVRMHFVKAAPAVKGKCAVEGAQGQGQGQGLQGKGKPPAVVKKKFIGGDEDDEDNEAAVLKPCVYKLR